MLPMRRRPRADGIVRGFGSARRRRQEFGEAGVGLGHEKAGGREEEWEVGKRRLVCRPRRRRGGTVGRRGTEKEGISEVVNCVHVLDMVK
ncbi:unnamed protein product [Chondrus crispus]|uniref:Uncharacterized protein n=1 Tax=Chondrus crispus TaxID=2769 RepID=R7Q8S3_CHOCR|nr:unnamed protein product [Chondrus crispus]CDF33875.1 unnamed protein product [Chondrus crispus]|eukprot:XP_005713694.1 unnamed protein product [Chondrus crispus]